MKGWLITGVSGGLGQALAKAVLARGDRVVGTVRRLEDKTAFEAAAQPGQAIGLLVDIADHDAIAPAIAEAEAALGQIDFLVNNAGYGIVGAIEEVSIAEAKALFNVNVFGAIAMIQAVLPGMRARRSGQIVNITSISGFAPWSGTAIYGASKYALECIGQTLAQEVKELGIHVTNVAPGSFRTGFAGRGLVEAARAIADYDQGARLAKLSLLEGQGREQGDPAKAAEAILAALGAAEPPMHLFLGKDALHYGRDQFTFIASEMDRWEALTTATDFEPCTTA